MYLARVSDHKHRGEGEGRGWEGGTLSAREATRTDENRMPGR